MAGYIGNKVPEKYTINGVQPDADGNFTVTATDLGSAEPDHEHVISDIDGLQEELDNKSNIIHTHPYVTSFQVTGDTALTGSINFAGEGDLTVQQNGSLISITQNAATQQVAESVTDASDGTTAIKTFVGTQAEWDAFTTDGISTYIVYLHP